MSVLQKLTPHSVLLRGALKDTVILHYSILESGYAIASPLWRGNTNRRKNIIAQGRSGPRIK